MHVDVIIVGGGLAGTALAVALRSAKLSVALVEGNVPTRTAGWDARIYAISPANAHFLESIGIWRNNNNLPAAAFAVAPAARAMSALENASAECFPTRPRRNAYTGNNANSARTHGY